MYKKISRYSLSIFFSIYFLTVGMGYNVINYCCDKCEIIGIEAVANESCQGVHMHVHKKNTTVDHDDITCSDLNHDTDNCHLYRLNLDTPTLHLADIYILNTILVQLLFNNEIELYNIYANIPEKGEIPPPKNHFLPSGREIISLNSVLII